MKNLRTLLRINHRLRPHIFQEAISLIFYTRQSFSCNIHRDLPYISLILHNQDLNLLACHSNLVSIRHDPMDSSPSANHNYFYPMF